MGNTKTIYQFLIPKFNNLMFETIGLSSMKNIAKQLNNDYKGLNFKVKRVRPTTIEDFMKQAYPKGETPTIFVPPNEIKLVDFETRVSNILGEKINIKQNVKSHKQVKK